MLALVVYVPEDHLDAVKNAMFQAGGGKIGNYDSCAWQVLGSGQFRPLKGSDPYLGKHGQVERVPEFRVELVCEDAVIQDVIAAMKAAHPYETPAFLVFESKFQ